MEDSAADRCEKVPGARLRPHLRRPHVPTGQSRARHHRGNSARRRARRPQLGEAAEEPAVAMG